MLNGRKQWCTNGSYRGVTDGDVPHRRRRARKGVSAFLIEAGTPGIAVEKVTEKLGIHTSNTCDLAFDDVAMSADALLGREGAGFGNAMTALTVGTHRHRGAGDRNPRRVSRRVGGVREGARRVRQDRSAPSRASRSRSRRWRRTSTRRACSCTAPPRWPTPDKPFAIAASKAKLFASTAARKHAAEALQIHGGYGYTTEFPVERHYRDAKITEIYEGTSEIQQLIIARSLWATRLTAKHPEPSNGDRMKGRAMGANSGRYESDGVSGQGAVSPLPALRCRAASTRTTPHEVAEFIERAVRRVGRQSASADGRPRKGRQDQVGDHRRRRTPRGRRDHGDADAAESPEPARRADQVAARRRAARDREGGVLRDHDRPRGAASRSSS